MPLRKGLIEVGVRADGIPTIFFHGVSPCAIPVQAAVRSLSGMVAPLNIVYNTVSNIIIIIENSCRLWCAGRAERVGRIFQIGAMMVGKPAKHAIARTPKSRQMTISPAREPAAAIIAKSIEEDIVLGRRQPRERLVEQDLCDLFQTHRGDVRLALFELEKKGLVERIPNRGALVRGLTPLEVTEIYAVREELIAATAQRSRCGR